MMTIKRLNINKWFHVPWDLVFDIDLKPIETSGAISVPALEEKPKVVILTGPPRK